MSMAVFWHFFCFRRMCKDAGNRFVDRHTQYGMETLEDLEDFIQTHMRVWECDRLTVEYHVARVMSELFTVKPKGRREPGAPGSLIKLPSKTVK